MIRIDLISIDAGVSQRRYDEHGTPSVGSDDTIRSTVLKNTRLGFIYSGSWAHCWLEQQPFTAARIAKVQEGGRSGLLSRPGVPEAEAAVSAETSRGSRRE